MKDNMEELYNSRNPLVRFMFNSKTKAILNQIPHEKIRILDAGCNNGHLLKTIHEKNHHAELYGFDMDNKALEIARNKVPTAILTKQDIISLEYEDNYFDVVICTEVLEHIIDYKKAVSELKRVMKEEGKLIITFPNEFNLIVLRFLFGRRPIKPLQHINSFTPNLIEKEVDLPMKSFNLPFNLLFCLSLITVCIFGRGIQ